MAEKKYQLWDKLVSYNEELRMCVDGTVEISDGKFPWDDDKYLSPVMEDDVLLYVFGEDEDDVDYPEEEDKDELVKEIEKLKVDDAVDERIIENLVSEKFPVNGWTDRPSVTNGHLKLNLRDQDSKVAAANAVSNDITKANRSYFGGYSSFVIHREMISDKVMTQFLTYCHRKI